MAYRVLTPCGRSLEAYLRLRSWDRARARLRELASDPRPAWARQVAGGWKVELGDGEWPLHRIDDDDEQVTVVVCHAA